MKQLATFPPNYEQIKRAFPVVDTYPAMFAFGEVLYAPHHEQIPEDILFHERIHTEQQKLFQSPELWWNKYLMDKEFRLTQEVEAYAAQYLWIKKNVHSKAAREALVELASNLASPLYNLGISYAQAETHIRRRVRKMVEYQKGHG